MYYAGYSLNVFISEFFLTYCIVFIQYYMIFQFFAVVKQIRIFRRKYKFQGMNLARTAHKRNIMKIEKSI